MPAGPHRRIRGAAIWSALGLAVGLPILLAAMSPLLAWRDPIYIASGLAGIIGLAIMLFQPLLVSAMLPGVTVLQGRRVHRWLGTVLVLAVVAHVGGLWITSPPDVIDALLFVSPTPFSDWGVIAMWALFGAALLAALKKSIHLAQRTWRMAHSTLVLIAVVGTGLHALLIEGTMEPISKIGLVCIVLFATATAIIRLKAFARRKFRASKP